MGYTLDTFLIFNNNLVFDLLVVPTSSELTRCSVDDLGVAMRVEIRVLVGGVPLSSDTTWVIP